MKILVLGGTVFLGRHLVDAALAAGDEVTIFHRGRSNPGLFASPSSAPLSEGHQRTEPSNSVRVLLGDRDGGLDALRGGRWDAVVDTSGFLPRLVKASAETLAGSVGHYTFISSGSVYSDDSTPDQDESAPVQSLSQDGSENVAADYGALKALCESAVEGAYPGRSLHVRFGLLVGPHDPTNRFTYWPRRAAAGGEILAPGRPDQRVQFIDARDGARWILESVRTGRAGVYNVTGPRRPLTMGELLATVLETVGASGPSRPVRSASAGQNEGNSVRLTWIDESFLMAHDVAPWTDLPLWLPESMKGALAVNIEKALGAGLTFRPLAETVRDTLAWDAARPAAERDGTARLSVGSRKIGLSREREAELLAAWRGGQP